MSLLRRAAAFVVAAALSFIATPPAFGANGVYGGTTSDDEPIVITTDAKGNKLRSAVVAWRAPCTSGRGFRMAISLRPVRAEPGFSPEPQDLVVSRNAKGRFAGTQLAAVSLVGDATAGISVDLSGRLRGSRASGKLVAAVTISDAAGTQVDSCDTSLSWSASRAAGRVFGGRTSQDNPIVVRLDRKRKTVSDLIVGWESSACEPPDDFFRFPIGFTNLRVRASKFGGTFDEFVPMDDGTNLTFGYKLAGSLARRSVRGSLKVSVTGTDAAGATTLTCSGDVTWKAATG
jgi:hypothetical protein